MPVNIVSDYPESGAFRRFFRRLIWLLGALLILTGSGAFVLVIIGTVGLVAFVEAPLLSAATLDNEGVHYFVASAAIMAVCLTLGLRLVRGRRRLVLFLRRFGLVGATQALTFALASTIGASWRMVTLDDAQVAPLGVVRGARWLSLGAGVVAVLLVAAGLPQAGKVIGMWIFLGPIVSSIVLGLILLLLAMCVAVAIYSGVGLLSIRRAERVKALEILTTDTIAPMALLVARRTRRILSARLVVVRVDSAIWQEVVRRFALLCSVVVIDISEPSENLLWEISTLRPEMRSRWILVGKRDNLTKMTAGAQGSLLEQQLLGLLEGEDILAYGVDGQGKKRFARALRARLDSVTLRQRS